MKKETQCTKIINWLKQHKTITQAQARAYCKCWRLAARIFDLKMDGYKISSEMQYNPRNKTKWAEYTLLSKKR